MAKPQALVHEQSRSERDHHQAADPGTGGNGHDDAVSTYEQELAGYLQERIKPGLNSGSIPLLARSIAKDIAHREHPGGVAEDRDEDDELDVDSDDEAGAQGEASPDFEDEMHELQAELGEDWILRFSVHGDDAWLTAEKDDGSQRVEAPTAAVIVEAVELLDEGNGRS